MRRFGSDPHSATRGLRFVPVAIDELDLEPVHEQTLWDYLTAAADLVNDLGLEDGST